MSLVSKSAERRIETAIEQVEAETAGELVVVLARRGDAYDRPRVIWGMALATALGVAAYLWLHDVPVLWILYAHPLLAVLFWWLFGMPPVLRRIVPSSLIDDAVAGMARRLFIERGLTETRDRSGVLLLLSEAEHRATILADKGIHERLGERTWQATLDRLIASLKQGQTEQGIINAVEEIGAQLAQHFPARADDTNELPNKVVRT